MAAYRIARTIKDRVRRDHLNDRPAWEADVELRDFEIWATTLIDEEFDRGWAERGWHKEENGDD
jgi:hypothetical protein